MFRSAQRPSVICSPALLRRPEEHITSGRFRFAQLPAVSPLAPHRARPCAPPGSFVQIITPAAEQRGRAQLALCAIMLPHAALRALRIARCLVPLILHLCYGKTLGTAVWRLFRIWDENSSPLSRSALRPPVQSSPALLRRSGELSTSVRLALLKLLSGDFSFSRSLRSGLSCRSASSCTLADSV